MTESGLVVGSAAAGAGLTAACLLALGVWTGWPRWPLLVPSAFSEFPHGLGDPRFRARSRQVVTPLLLCATALVVALVCVMIYVGWSVAIGEPEGAVGYATRATLAFVMAYGLATWGITSRFGARFGRVGR
jgi:hypothetical protein